MKLLRDLGRIPAGLRGGAVSVGVFDGVHLGHQCVLGRAVEKARALGAPALVFTFHPHPQAVLDPDHAPPLIQTFGRKLDVMRGLGMDAVVWPEAMVEVLAMPPEIFFDEVLVKALAARAVVEGEDFRFGAGAAGTVSDLARLAGGAGLEVETVSDLVVDGRRISSTRVRNALRDGRVEEAARCLGRPFTYVGTVIEGHHRGNVLGYPTVNLDAPDFLKPGDGVYAGWAEVGGERVMAAVAVGRAPTFQTVGPSIVEAFLLDFDGELYGRQIAIAFEAFVRPLETFPDAPALTRQLRKDCARVREILGAA